MKNGKIRSAGILFIIILMGILAGCSLSEDEDPSENDWDGDGLENTYEITIGTNPNRADTDGDGWDDKEELDFGETFSPLLANLPGLAIEILNVPEITLHETVSDSTTHEQTIAEASSTTMEITTTRSRTESTALENGWSMEATLGYNLGVESKVTYAATAGYSGSYTSESGYSWGKEQTESNTESIEAARSYAATNEVSYNGATLTVDVKLINTSTIAYSLEDLIISGYRMNTSSHNYGSYSPIGLGDMKIDGLGSGGKITLNAGAESGALTLSQDIPSPSAAISLAQDCPNLVFAISGYSASTSGGGLAPNDFTHEMTQVAALCAKVNINPGTQPDAPEAEQYLVAAQTKYNPESTSISDRYTTLSLKDIFTNMGLAEDADYTTADDGHLIEFAGVAEGDVTSGQWLLIIENPGGDRTFYSALDEEGYDIESLFIKPGYTVTLCYTVDEDGDGLVLAIEEMYGSSDATTDSDDDTIGDADEVIGWDLGGETVYTNPALADTDGDGMNDNDDPDPVSLSKNVSAEIISLSVRNRLEEETVFTEGEDGFTGEAISGAYVKIDLRVLEDVSSVRIAGSGLPESSMDKDSTDTTLYSYEIVPIPVGENVYAITVTSEDELIQKEYELTLDSELEDISSLTLTDENLNSSGTRYQMDLGFNWGSYYDSRADGALLLYSWGQDPPSAYHLPESVLLPKTLKQDASATEYAASDETAVYLWNSTGYGSVELEDSSGEFFLGSYYDRQYSFRVVPYVLQDGLYYYAPGRDEGACASFTTPFPRKIVIDDIDITFDWEEPEGYGVLSDNPEFRIHIDLDDKVDTFEDSAFDDMGANKIMDLTLRKNTPWKPDNGDDNPWTDYNDDVNLTVDLSDLDSLDDIIFVIDHYIDEEEPVGEHLISKSDRKVQFEETSDDEIYGLNVPGEGRYGKSVEIDSQKYGDNDKGYITVTWDTTYHTYNTL